MRPFKLFSKLLKAQDTLLLLIKIDAIVPTDPADAMKQLASHNIYHLNIIIAKAGFIYIWLRMSEVRVEDMQKHFILNIFGFVWLSKPLCPF